MIGWLILAAVLALCAVLCIRAARFKPEAGAGAAPTPVAVDTEGAVQRLAQLVRIPTVSNYDAEKFDACMAEYNALAKKIPALEQEWLELSEKMEANAHE